MYHYKLWPIVSSLQVEAWHYKINPGRRVSWSAPVLGSDGWASIEEWRGVIEAEGVCKSQRQELSGGVSAGSSWPSAQLLPVEDAASPPGRPCPCVKLQTLLPPTFCSRSVFSRKASQTFNVYTGLLVLKSRYFWKYNNPLISLLCKYHLAFDS